MAVERDIEAPEGLKHAAVRGGMILLSGKMLHLVLNISSMLILARLLVPEDFGLFAMVAVLMNFLVIFTDPGLSIVTMQRQGITQQQLSNLFWVNAGLGFVLALLMWMLAPVLLWFYGDDRIFNMVCALASVFLITGLGIQHEALLRREMHFRKLVSIEVSVLVCAIIIALLCAVNGAGVWALVAMMLATAILKTLALWIFARWIPMLPARHVGMRELLEFGGQLTASNVITYFMKNVDDMLIGWRWGATSLGLYNMAYRLFLLPTEQILGSLSSVAIVTLSRLTKRPEHFKSFYLRMVMAIAYVSMPLIMLVGILSEDIFVLILGEKWAASAAIFTVFACVALLQPVTASLGWVVISYGHTQRVLRWSIVGVPIMIAGYAIGLQWGAIGVAVGYAVTFFMLAIPHVIYYLRDSPIRVLDFWRVLARPFFVSVIMGIPVVYVRFFVEVSSPWLLGMSLVASFGVLLFLIVVWSAVRTDMRYIIDVIRFAMESRNKVVK